MYHHNIEQNIDRANLNSCLESFLLHFKKQEFLLLVQSLKCSIVIVKDIDSISVSLKKQDFDCETSAYFGIMEDDVKLMQLSIQ